MNSSGVKKPLNTEFIKKPDKSLEEIIAGLRGSNNKLQSRNKSTTKFQDTAVIKGPERPIQLV